MLLNTCRNLSTCIRVLLDDRLSRVYVRIYLFACLMYQNESTHATLRQTTIRFDAKRNEIKINRQISPLEYSFEY